MDLHDFPGLGKRLKIDPDANNSTNNIASKVTGSPTHSHSISDDNTGRQNSSSYNPVLPLNKLKASEEFEIKIERPDDSEFFNDTDFSQSGSEANQSEFSAGENEGQNDYAKVKVKPEVLNSILIQQVSSIQSPMKSTITTAHAGDGNEKAGGHVVPLGMFFNSAHFLNKTDRDRGSSSLSQEESFADDDMDGGCEQAMGEMCHNNELHSPESSGSSTCIKSTLLKPTNERSDNSASSSSQQSWAKAKAYTKPKLPLHALISVAIKNSQTGAVATSELCNFIRHYFPYYKCIHPSWKGSVQRILSLSHLFTKVEDTDSIPHKTRSSTKALAPTHPCVKWRLNGDFRGKIDGYLKQWTNNPPTGLVDHIMHHPEIWNALVKGQVKSLIKPQDPLVQNQGNLSESPLELSAAQKTNPVVVPNLEKSSSSEVVTSSCEQIIKRKKWSLIGDLEYTVATTLCSQLVDDEEKFYNYTKMSRNSFEFLLDLVKVRINRIDTRWRNAIKPRERLILTLRYLVSGDNFNQLHEEMKIGRTTIREIVFDTLDAICNALKDSALPRLTKTSFQEMSVKFYKKWNYPHCLGAVGCKVINVHIPSLSYLVLQGVTDADGNFISVDVIETGGKIDGSSFKKSDFGEALMKELLPIPEADKLLDYSDELTEPLPYVFIGGVVQKYSKNVLRPYSRKQCINDEEQRIHNEKMKIYNERHLAALNIIDCVFNSMFAKYVVLRKTLKMSVDHCYQVLLSCCVLHNFLNSKEGTIVYGPPDNDVRKRPKLNPNKEIHQGRPTTKVLSTRDQFAELFLTSLHIPSTKASMSSVDGPATSTSNAIQSHSEVMLNSSDASTANPCDISTKNLSSISKTYSNGVSAENSCDFSSENSSNSSTIHSSDISTENPCATSKTNSRDISTVMSHYSR